MTLPIVLTAEAEADFDDSADWYEEQAGLREQFTIQVRKILNQVGQMPELHRVLHQDVRRAKVQRFPYNRGVTR